MTTHYIHMTPYIHLIWCMTHHMYMTWYMTYHIRIPTTTYCYHNITHQLDTYTQYTDDPLYTYDLIYDSLYTYDNDYLLLGIATATAPSTTHINLTHTRNTHTTHCIHITWYLPHRISMTTHYIHMTSYMTHYMHLIWYMTHHMYMTWYMTYHIRIPTTTYCYHNITHQLDAYISAVLFDLRHYPESVVVGIGKQSTLYTLASGMTVAACCSVMQCVAVCCRALQWFFGNPSAPCTLAPDMTVAACCSILQCVAVCCSVL